MSTPFYNAKNLIKMRLTRRVVALKQYAKARSDLSDYLQLQPEEQDSGQLLTLTNELASRLNQLRVIDEAIETLELFVQQD